MTSEELKHILLVKFVEAANIIKTIDRLRKEFDLWQDDIQKIETRLYEIDQERARSSIEGLIDP